MVSGVRKCEGIAIDWAADNIYWTDKVLRIVSVAKLTDPNIRRIVVNASKIFHPRVIAVDPTRG